MNALFINISNHPSSKWEVKQIDAALAIANNGPIIDMIFPNIDPNMESSDVIDLAEDYFSNVINLISEYEADYVVFHIMGEMTFTYNLVKLLKENGYHCYASTTKRNVIEKEDGSKVSVFEFIKFREY